MRILLDHGTPVPLRRELTGHAVSTLLELGWETLTNGELLKTAEGKFDVLITTDQGLRYQQNLAGRRLSVLVLMTKRWPTIQENVSLVIEALDRIAPGSLMEVTFQSR